MLIKVFGPGCSKCKETEHTVLEAVEASGMNADVNGYLFGSILAMGRGDVVLSVVLSGIVLVLFCCCEYIGLQNRLFLLSNGTI